MIETQHLLLMQTIVQCQGNLTQAAERLHLSQPAISKQVKQLEMQLGLILIDRDKRPARLTAAGKQLLALAEAVLPLIAQAERRLAELNEGHHQQLRVAVECDICYDWLMPAMSAYQQLWPSVDMDLVTGQQSTPAQLIERDEADFILATQVPHQEHFAAHSLFDYELQAIVPIQHALAEKPYLTAADFSDVCLLHFPRTRLELDLFRQVLVPAGVEPSMTRTHHLAAGLVQLVAAGKGVAALPSWALIKLPDNFPVRIKSIGDKGTWITLYGITQADNSGKTWLRDFVRLIREQQKHHC
jgi:LysR family transcriptional regulator for metE and metH